jgi:hypothetical protein
MFGGPIIYILGKTRGYPWTFQKIQNGFQDGRRDGGRASKKSNFLTNRLSAISNTYFLDDLRMDNPFMTNHF